MDIFYVHYELENNPLIFLKADKSTQNKVLEALKIQYDSLKIQEKLDSLVVDDFTSEQIWQQVDLVNEKLNSFVKEMAFDVARKDEILISVKAADVNDISESVEPKNHDKSDRENKEGKDSASEENQDQVTLEKRNEKLKQRIEQLENKALEEKPWPLKGEVDSKERPINSLFEEYLEFDMTQRPAPIITEEVTLKLEDVILKRIKDKVFDNVERKIKPVLTPHELKKTKQLFLIKKKASCTSSSL